MHKVAIIIPVYNGANTIGRLVKEVITELREYILEIILVVDGSPDNSSEVCNELSQKFSNVTSIVLRKNVGEHGAVICGLNYSKSNYNVIIDDDFQNPPSEIESILKKAFEGYDVVYSKYKTKKHSFFRNLASKLNDFTATVLLSKPHNLYLSSFKVIHSDIVEEIIKYKGPFPYIDGLILRSTSNIGVQLVKHQERQAGASGYTLRKLLSLYLNMFFNFSVIPLRIFTFIGFLFFVMGLFAAIYIVAEHLFNPDSVVPGWTSLAIIVLTLMGFQIMFIGLVSEYIGKMFLDHNKTPQFVIRSVFHKQTTNS